MAIRYDAETVRAADCAYGAGKTGESGKAMTPRAEEIKSVPLPRFHPATVIRRLGNGQNFTIADAVTGVAVFGATGSGKHLAQGAISRSDTSAAKPKWEGSCSVPRLP
jgi:hypothetical protein